MTKHQAASPTREDIRKFDQLMLKYRNLYVRVNTDLDSNRNRRIKSIIFTSNPNIPTGFSTATSKTSVAPLENYRDEILRSFGHVEGIELIKKIAKEAEEANEKMYITPPKRPPVDPKLLRPTPQAVSAWQILSPSERISGPKPTEPTDSLSKGLSRTGFVGTGFSTEAMARAREFELESQQRILKSAKLAQKEYSKGGAISNPFRSVAEAEQRGELWQRRHQSAKALRNAEEAARLSKISEAHGVRSSADFFKQQEEAAALQRQILEQEKKAREEETKAFRIDLNYVRENLNDIKKFVIESSLSDDHKKVMTHFFNNIKPENLTTRQDVYIKDLANYHQAYKQSLQQNTTRNSSFLNQIDDFWQQVTAPSANTNDKVAAQNFKDKLQNIAQQYKQSLDVSGISIQETEPANDARIGAFGRKANAHSKFRTSQEYGQPIDTSDQKPQNPRGIIQEELAKKELLEKEVDTKFEKISKLRRHSPEDKKLYKDFYIEAFDKENIWGKDTIKYFQKLNDELGKEIDKLNRINPAAEQAEKRRAARLEEEDARKSHADELKRGRIEAEERARIKAAERERIAAAERERRLEAEREESRIRAKKIQKKLEQAKEDEELRIKIQEGLQKQRETIRRENSKKENQDALDYFNDVREFSERLAKRWPTNEINQGTPSQPTKPSSRSSSPASQALTVVHNSGIPVDFADSDYYQLKKDLSDYNNNIELIRSFKFNPQYNLDFWSPKFDKAQKSVDRCNKFQKFCNYIQENADKLDEMDDISKVKFTKIISSTHELLDKKTIDSLKTTKFYKDYHKNLAQEEIAKIEQDQQTTYSKQSKLSKDNLLSLAQNVITSGDLPTAEKFSELLEKHCEKIDMQVLITMSSKFSDKAGYTNMDLAEKAIKALYQKADEADTKLQNIYSLKDAKDINLELPKLDFDEILTSANQNSIEVFQNFLKTNSHLIDTKTFKSLKEKLEKPLNNYDSNSQPALDKLTQFIFEKSESFRTKDNVKYLGYLAAKTSLSCLGKVQNLFNLIRPSSSPTQPEANSAQNNQPGVGRN